MPDSPRRRSRSRSPPRRPKAGGGFKWKNRRTDSDDRRDDRGLQRGYRDRSPRRDRERDRDRESGRDRDRDRGGNRDRSPRRDRSRDRDRERDGDRPRRSDRDNRDRSPRNNSNNNRSTDRDRDSQPKPKRSKPPPPTTSAAPAPAASTAAPGEQMILVTVNDRLGTKAQIPAFPSDTVGQFKIMVAMKVGREPHEILLKRQGERPFKDMITLGDYGVSNGVQLDLEVDTGD
ncbi:ubiquitin-related domain-containing protein [Chaetomium fimeti]|uniref:Ubiquitin-like modifier HUB1 n=1 Tax=Chaetomium fimeti TaxID=1854472 RepID=A0AAE0HJY5_9PEZI|nr:ubiquitin-related domain-containing protein [Chaetomium fimeti]